MDKEKSESLKKSKDVIIFSPQELVDLGILQNIQKVQASSNVKSKANKKRIIQVIQQSIQTKTETSPSASVSSSVPAVNSHDLKKNLMGKLSPLRSTQPENENSEGKIPPKIINAEVAMPTFPLRGKAVVKSPPLIVKKIKKKAYSELIPMVLSKTPAKSILNKDKRIKDIIISAVHSGSKQASHVAQNISKDNEKLDSSSHLPSDKQLHIGSNRVNDASDQTEVEIQPRVDKTLSLSNKFPLKVMKKDIKVVSNTEISLTKEQIKNLIRPKTRVQDIVTSNQLKGKKDNENEKVKTERNIESKTSKGITEKINVNTTPVVNYESTNVQNNSIPGMSTIIGCEKVEIDHKTGYETIENLSKADFFNCKDSTINNTASSTLEYQDTGTEIRTTEVDVEKGPNKVEPKKLDSTTLNENKKDLPSSSSNILPRDSDRVDIPFELSKEPSIDVLKSTTIVCSDSSPTEKHLPEPTNQTEKLGPKKLENSAMSSKDIKQKEIVFSEKKILFSTEVFEDGTQSKFPVEPLDKDNQNELLENIEADNTKIPSSVLKKNKQQATRNCEEKSEEDHSKIKETNTPNKVPTNQTDKPGSKGLENSAKSPKVINQKQIVFSEKNIVLSTEVSEDSTESKFPVEPFHKVSQNKDINLLEIIEVDNTKIPSSVLKKNKQQATTNCEEKAEEDHSKIKETNTPNEVPTNQTDKPGSKGLENSAKSPKVINQKQIVFSEKNILLSTEVSEDSTESKFPVEPFHKVSQNKDINLLEIIEVDNTKIPSSVLKKNKQQATTNCEEKAEEDHSKIKETNTPNEVPTNQTEKPGSKGLENSAKSPKVINQKQIVFSEKNILLSTEVSEDSTESKFPVELLHKVSQNKDINLLENIEGDNTKIPSSVLKKNKQQVTTNCEEKAEKDDSKIKETNTPNEVLNLTDNISHKQEQSKEIIKEKKILTDNVNDVNEKVISNLNNVAEENEKKEVSSVRIVTTETSQIQTPMKVPKKRGRSSKNQPNIIPEKTVSKTNTNETNEQIDDNNEELINSSVTSETGGSELENNSNIEEKQFSGEISNKHLRNDDNAIPAPDEMKQIEFPPDPSIKIPKKRGRSSKNQPNITPEKTVSKTNTNETNEQIDDINEEPVNSSVISKTGGRELENNSNIEEKQFSGEISNKHIRNDDNAIPAPDEMKQIELPTDPSIKIPKKRGRSSKNQPNITPEKTVSKTNTKETDEQIDDKNEEPVNSSVTSETGGSELENSSNIEEKQFSGEISNKHLRNDDNAIPAPDEMKQIELPTDPSIKIPKKRGRPRKNPLDPPKPKKPKLDTSNESVLDNSFDGVKSDNVEMDTSKSGRKRRKINYFKMENIFLDELTESKSKYQSPENEGEEKTVNIKSRKLSFDSPASAPKTEASAPKTEKEEKPVEIKRKPSIESPVSVPKIESDVIKSESLGKCEVETFMNSGNIPMEVIEEPSTEIEESVTNQESTPTSPKEKKSKSNKKYNWTGETQKMVKSIFSAAMKATMTGNNSNQQDEGGEEEQQPQYTSRGRGRRKKGQQTFTSAIIDNDGYVKCNTCNRKVVNKEWQSHNRNVHYNLAWREGEQFLNVDDPIFVRRTLTPIIHEDKGLVCTNCTYSFYVANEFITHREQCLGIVKDGLVTCAICLEQVDKLKWLTHKKKKHNNLTWRVGDPPLDLNNQEMVLYILNTFYKAKIPLYCYKCRTSKKSVVGFLSHQAQCGIDIENAKIPCPLCGKRILPVSMPTHNKLVHEPKPDKPVVEEVTEPSGGKRKAAKQAMRMIDILSKSKLDTISTMQYIESPNFKEEEFILKFLNEELEENQILKCKYENCDYTHEKLEQMVEHLAECPKKPEQFFICKKCFSLFPLEQEVRNHIRIVHNRRMIDGDYVDNDSSDGEDEDKKILAKIRQYEKDIVAKNANTRVKPRFLSSTPKDKRLFSNAFEYTLEFCNEHFTESVLFDRLRYKKTDWKLLNDQHLKNYMPQAEFSCHVNTKVVTKFANMLQYDHTFNQLELFEVFEEEDGATIFCGGPISAMAWQPTPHILLNCKQVLAVAAAKDFDAKYLVNTNYNEPCLIQFWDFGVLKKKITPSKPKFLFGLAISYGPIWHMEWCPSGCFDEKVFNIERMQRMGLLAVAGSMPTVNIYAIPFIEEDDDIGLIYRAQPVVRLQLCREYDKIKTKCFPTRISWSKFSGHRYVAVGYTDGMVAIFDIETQSDILKHKDHLGIETILPFKTLKAHIHYISVLSLIHLGGGRRYLLTGSFDRNIVLWDLTDDSCIMIQRKKIISDGTWLTNWISHVSTADESCTSTGNINSTVISHRYYLSDLVHIMATPASLTSVSSSDWLNGIIQATSSGEVLAIFPNQLLYGLDNDKRLKSLKWMLGYTKLIDLTKTPEERVLDDEVERKSIKHEKKNDNTTSDSTFYILNYGDQLKQYEPHTYEKVVEKYGLVICDIKRKGFEEPPFNLSDVLEPSRPDLYPLQAINKIAFNPNCQSSLYFAAGYQAGFVRLRYMRFLENDKQVV